MANRFVAVGTKPRSDPMANRGNFSAAGAPEREMSFPGHDSLKPMTASDLNFRGEIIDGTKEIIIAS